MKKLIDLNVILTALNLQTLEKLMLQMILVPKFQIYLVTLLQHTGEQK